MLEVADDYDDIDTGLRSTAHTQTVETRSASDLRRFPVIRNPQPPGQRKILLGHRGRGAKIRDMTDAKVNAETAAPYGSRSLGGS